LLLIKVHFDEFESKLKVNEGNRVEVMKVLQAMNEKMFCLIKIHDLNLTTLPHKSSHAFLKIKVYYV
jgi:ABC-type cobalamin/Fe3+-siderophores transport system ATPase subunit